MKQLIFIPLFLFTSVFLLIGQENIHIVDVVQIIDGHDEAANFYYSENWEEFRIHAQELDVIKGFRKIEKQALGDPFDLIFITSFADRYQFDRIEEEFTEIMEEIRPDGPLFLNDLRPNEFRKFFQSFILHTPLSLEDATPDVLEIIRNVHGFSENMMSGDEEALANAYTPEGVVLSPGTAMVKGRASIQDFWKSPEGVQTVHHKIQIEELHHHGNIMFDIGTYEGKSVNAADEEIGFTGKYLIVWKKENGKWKMYADMWNR